MNINIVQRVVSCNSVIINTYYLLLVPARVTYAELRYIFVAYGEVAVDSILEVWIVYSLTILIDEEVCLASI